MCQMVNDSRGWGGEGGEWRGCMQVGIGMGVQVVGEDKGWGQITCPSLATLLPTASFPDVEVKERRNLR